MTSTAVRKLYDHFTHNIRMSEWVIKCQMQLCKKKNKKTIFAWKSMFEGAAERPHLRIGESQYATLRAVIAK